MVLRPRRARLRLAHNADDDVAFRTTNNVGTPDEIISWLNSPACTYPC